MLTKNDIKILRHSTVCHDIVNQDKDGNLTGDSTRYYYLKIGFPKINDNIFQLSVEFPISKEKIKVAIKEAYQKTLEREKDKEDGKTILSNTVDSAVKEGIDENAK